MTPDDLVTAMTNADSEDAAMAVAAMAVAAMASRELLLATADLLYVDAEGKSGATVRRTIVKEARS